MRLLSGTCRVSSSARSASSQLDWASQVPRAIFAAHCESCRICTGALGPSGASSKSQRIGSPIADNSAALLARERAPIHWWPRACVTTSARSTTSGALLVLFG
eukprot:2179342-Pyramimonas_sp.AAC.1